MKNHWLVIFKDSPEMLNIRKKKFADHLAYLQNNPTIFVDGSSLSESEGSSPVGGIWILSATNREEILTLIENDPMYDPNHRSFEIFATGKQLKTREN